MKEYKVVPLATGLFSGCLDERKLEAFLNEYGRQGWRFVRSVQETRRVLGIFAREAHFVIFERDAA